MTTSTMLSAKLTRTAGLLAIAFVLTGIAPAVLAADKIAVVKTIVRFGDLNLDAEAGAQALVTRIERAATNLCRENSTGAPIQLQRATQKRFVACRDGALRNAVVTLDHPLVTQVYLSSHPSDERVASR